MVKAVKVTKVVKLTKQPAAIITQFRFFICP
jgi:hypothetical protein